MEGCRRTSNAGLRESLGLSDWIVSIQTSKKTPHIYVGDESIATAQLLSNVRLNVCYHQARIRQALFHQCPSACGSHLCGSLKL